MSVVQGEAHGVWGRLVPVLVRHDETFSCSLFDAVSA